AVGKTAAPCGSGPQASGTAFHQTDEQGEAQSKTENQNQAEEEKEMKAKIHVTLKNGVLDPQGRAIAGALHNLGFPQVDEVRQGKYIEVEIKETDQAKATAAVEKMCASLLANTVIENYRFELTE